MWTRGLIGRGVGLGLLVAGAVACSGGDHGTPGVGGTHAEGGRGGAGGNAGGAGGAGTAGTGAGGRAVGGTGGPDAGGTGAGTGGTSAGGNSGGWRQCRRRQWWRLGQGGWWLDGKRRQCGTRRFVAGDRWQRRSRRWRREQRWRCRRQRRQWRRHGRRRRSRRIGGERAQWREWRGGGRRGVSRGILALGSARNGQRTGSRALRSGDALGGDRVRRYRGRKRDLLDRPDRSANGQPAIVVCQRDVPGAGQQQRGVDLAAHCRKLRQRAGRRHRRHR